jgi:hypothetical protein
MDDVSSSAGDGTLSGNPSGWWWIRRQDIACYRAQRYDNSTCRYAVPEGSAPPPCVIRRGDEALVLDFAPRW